MAKRPFILGPAPKLSEQQQQEVVRLHRDERVGTKELAEVYNVSQGTIQRILRRFNAVNRPMASAREKQIIVRMSKQRKTRAEIEKVLRRSCSFVFNWQKKLHCQLKDRRPTERQKNQICRLYQSGMGQVAVAVFLGFTQRTILDTLAERRILRHRSGGRAFKMAPEEFSKFRADVLSKKYFAIDLARKYKITKAISLRLCKEILGVPEFLRGETFPPLSSVFPERHDKRLGIAGYVQFLAKLFPTGLPPQPDHIIVPSVIDLLCETFPFWRTASVPVLEHLESHLLAAASTMRGATQTKGEWLN
jgi:hypothetical protein